MSYAGLSRRAFAQLLGAGAAIAAAPSLVAGNWAEPDSVPTKTAGIVRLSSNENPYGASEAAFEAMRKAFSLTWRYPDEHADALIAAIAKFHGVPHTQVLLGDGSSEILKLAAGACTNRERHLLMADPTFEAIGFNARSAGAEIVRVPLDAHYAHDLPKMLASVNKQTGIIYICNPNNPTGSITPKAALRSFIEAVPSETVVLVDEAYFHYASSPDFETAIPLVAAHPNLVVARTFSKVHALAGLRCGYAIGHPALIARLGEQGVWDSINIMALVAARASLADTDHVALGVRRNRETKAHVVAQLAALGHRTIPSEANFIMVDLGRDVKPVIAAMAERKVEVGRAFAALPNHLRVTIGKPEEMAAFIAALKHVLA